MKNLVRGAVAFGGGVVLGALGMVFWAVSTMLEEMERDDDDVRYDLDALMRAWDEEIDDDDPVS